MRVRRRSDMLWLTVPMMTVVGTVLVLLAPGGREIPSGGGARSPDKGTNLAHAGHDQTSPSRSLLQFVDDHIHSTGEPDLRYLDGEVPNCTLASILQFPPDPMPASVRRNGGVLMHVLVVVYMFSAIAIVCDDYFVPSLETTSTRLGLSHNVAGATFMAVGSSAPELFVAMLGVFVTKNDVGVETVVGSAIFNVLVITGLTALCSSTLLSLSWWPLFRDSFFYLISVVTLVLIIYDEKVYSYEAMVLLGIYCLYIFVMYLDPRISKWATDKVKGWHMSRESSALLAIKHSANTNPDSYQTLENEGETPAETDGNKNTGNVLMAAKHSANTNPDSYQTRENELENPAETDGNITGNNKDSGNGSANTNPDSYQTLENKGETPAETDGNKDVASETQETKYREPDGNVSGNKDGGNAPTPTRTAETDGNRDNGNGRRIWKENEVNRIFAFGSGLCSHMDGYIDNLYHTASVQVEKKDPEKAPPAEPEKPPVPPPEAPRAAGEGPPKRSLLTVPEGKRKIAFFLNFPIHAVLYVTIPDCHSDGTKHRYLLTFFMTTLWIAVFSYVLVWMSTII
ncbi:hypothetical protein Bbelb_228800, partial [Branchiostoma belcheri]